MPDSATCAGTPSMWPTRRSASRSCSCSPRASGRPSFAGPRSVPDRGVASDHGADTIHRMVIPVGAEPRRADRWAADLSGMSRSHVQRLISEGRLTLGDAPVKANFVVGGGATLELRVPPPAPAEPVPQPEIPLAIVYEDDDLLI